MPTGLTLASLSTLRRLKRFALELSDDTLSPRYIRGDVLICDTDATPQHGDGIIVHLPLTGQILACLWDRESSSAYNHAGGRLRSDQFEIVAAVTDILPG